jgi:hypothetical protein
MHSNARRFTGMHGSTHRARDPAGSVVMSNTVPPRYSNDDDEEDDLQEENEDERQDELAVIREPDE